MGDKEKENQAYEHAVKSSTNFLLSRKVLVSLTQITVASDLCERQYQIHLG